MEDVTQKHTLPQCPQGYITQVSADVPSGEEQLEGSCAAQVESPEGDVQLVGRFCVADPCTGSKCIRKCCPHGMAISGLTHSCLSHRQNFTPEVRSDGGVVEDAGDMLILGGSKLPNCTLGIQMLRPNIDSYDEFHLLLSGSAYVPSHSMDYDEYCTDTFLDHNMTVIFFNNLNSLPWIMGIIHVRMAEWSALQNGKCGDPTSIPAELNCSKLLFKSFENCLSFWIKFFSKK